VIVAELRRDGLSIIDAIKAVRKACGVSLGEAKAIVTSNAAWADVAQESQSLREEAWKLFSLKEEQTRE
jgi:ribosomal protein L7/L12